MSDRDTSRSEIPTESEPHPSTGQPVGLPVDVTPARRPGPVTLEGRYGRVEKLDVRPPTCGRPMPGTTTSGRTFRPMDLSR